MVGGASAYLNQRPRKESGVNAAPTRNECAARVMQTRRREIFCDTKIRKVFDNDGSTEFRC